MYAMSAAVKDANLELWMHMPVVWPMRLHVNNAAGESFQHSTCGSSKLQGVFNYHDKWVRELKDEARVNAVRIATDRNLADMLTKGLTAEVRAKLHKCLMDVSETVASGSVSNKVEKVHTKGHKVIKVNTESKVAK